MQVLIVIVFAISAVSALGSGPYLPSGWRPQGPSFYLPSEVSTSIPSQSSPLKENLLQETEASGSDALREYGPPKVEEVVQFSVNQGLPDVATEQTFFVQSLGTQDLQSAVEESAAKEASTEHAVEIEEVASTTEAQLAQTAAEEQTKETLTEAQPTFEATPLEFVAEIVEQNSVTEEATEEVQDDNLASTAVYAEEEIVTSTAVAQDGAPVVEEAVVPTVADLEDIIVPTTVVDEVIVGRVDEETNNADKALVKLENDVKTTEAVEAGVEMKDEVTGPLQQGPEGFLEYGPPKAENIARSTAVLVAPANGFENNEVRRRRFSPKFKSGHNKH